MGTKTIGLCNYGGVCKAQNTIHCGTCKYFSYMGIDYANEDQEGERVLEKAW